MFQNACSRCCRFPLVVSQDGCLSLVSVQRPELCVGLRGSHSANISFIIIMIASFSMIFFLETFLNELRLKNAGRE